MPDEQRRLADAAAITEDIDRLLDQASATVAALKKILSAAVAGAAETGEAAGEPPP